MISTKGFFLILLIGVTYCINIKIFRISALELKKHEQVDLIFAERLQKLDYNELQNLQGSFLSFGWLGNMLSNQ